MKKSRFLWTFGLLVILTVALTTPASGGQEKVDVCHVTATYDFGQGEVPIGHVITIADPAYDTHIAHGDPEVWELRTLSDGSQVCTATVNPVNEPPNALDDDYSPDEDTPLIVSALEGVLANDADSDGDPLTAVLDTGPSHGELTLNEDGSFTFTPDADYFGPDSFAYVANDGALDSNIAIVILTVNSVNDAPTAADDAYSTDEDVALTLSALGVLGNDGDVEGDSLSAVLDTGPTHGTLVLSGDGGFTYMPNADYYGPDSFTYHASDDTLDSNIATVILTVNPVNDAPTAADDAYSTDQDVALTVSAPGVLGNDADVDGDSLSAVLDTGPSNGDLTLNADGSFTYTPSADYNGDDSFTYHASDGDLSSDIATVIITVNPVTEPPTQATVFITSQTYTGATLGGLVGADAKCQALADAAGLEGTYKAWLSSSLVDARDRLIHSDVPYVLIDGTQIADSWADLAGDPYLDSQLNRTEWNEPLTTDRILTASSHQGVFNQDQDCYGWTDSVDWPPLNTGYNHYLDTWSFYPEGSVGCGEPVHLYCFQQVIANPATVFVTSQTSTGATLGGLVGADAKCQALADAAGLEGTYKAWLSTSTVDARDRLIHSDVPYVLTDGTQIADSWADLVGDPYLDSQLNRTEWDEPLTTDRILTASSHQGVFNQSQDCYGWTGNDDSYPISTGYNHYLDTWSFYPEGSVGCGEPVHLYCFQQVIANPVTVFVTSGAYPGSGLGGLAGADAKCQARADAAGLEGFYKAWLSTSTVDARDRLTHSDIPYVRTDGIQIADNWADLTDHFLDAPIRLTEYGAVSLSYVWTGTDHDGSFASGYTDCGAWTFDDTSLPALLGNSSAFSDPDLWTHSLYSTGCSDSAALYCFEQVVTSPSKTVFVTSGAYPGSGLGGLAGADAKCQARADAAGLEGTYMAWLSTSTVDARDRLTHSDAPYVLVDGTQVADNWAGLTDHVLDAPIRLTEYGAVSLSYAWTGTDYDGSFASGYTDCGAWTLDDTSLPALLGNSSAFSDPDLWTHSLYSTSCSSSAPLYCFEQ